MNGTFSNYNSKANSFQIGELISEITEKGFTEIEIDVEPCDLDKERPPCFVGVRNSRKGDPDGVFSVDAGSLVECLRIIVDRIRRSRDEPSLEEELQKLITADQEHEAKGEAQTACHCGSTSPLKVNRVINWGVHWDSGRFEMDEFWENGDAKPATGEIGTCPDCGKSYKFL